MTVTTHAPPVSTADGIGGDASGDRLKGLSDHELLAAVAADQCLLNRLEASRQAKVAELFARRSRDFEARRATDPHFTLTPVKETAVEVSPLVGMTEFKVKQDLSATRRLQAQFPAVWELVCDGRLDLYRAGMVAEAGRKLGDPALVAQFAEEITRWLHRRLERQDRAAPVLSVTSRQLGNRISYLVKKLRPRPADDDFAKRFADRSAEVTSTGDGMAELRLTSDVASLRAVDQRLRLIAKAMRKAGDERTLAQLRTDLAVDLLLGRLTVGASTGEFADAAEGRTPGGMDPLSTIDVHALGAFARPVINVTVPIQTLMGLSDEPGIMAGGEVLPGGLVRSLSANKESTWYRMLTDPARQCVELSTTSYKPTGPIVRQLVADFGTCLVTGCVVPAEECDIDHRVRAPEGATSTENLGPACRGHHTSKHAPGFGLLADPDGSLVFKTAGGFRHPVFKVDQPVGDSWGGEEMWEQPVTYAELRDALCFLAHERARAGDTAARLRAEDEQAWADYRASYPEATDEEIAGWVHDDDAQAPTPPPVLEKGLTLEQALAADQPPPVDRTGLDVETCYDLDEYDQLKRLTADARFQ